MTPIERIVDVIEEWRYAPCSLPGCPGGLDCPANKKRAARAVIEAIREPSEAMKRAGSTEMGEGLCRDDGSWTEEADVWTAMIDALLEEG